jgi:hypothetical protein
VSPARVARASQIYFFFSFLVPGQLARRRGSNPEPTRHGVTPVRRHSRPGRVLIGLRAVRTFAPCDSRTNRAKTRRGCSRSTRSGGARPIACVRRAEGGAPRAQAATPARPASDWVLSGQREPTDPPSGRCAKAPAGATRCTLRRRPTTTPSSAPARHQRAGRIRLCAMPFAPLARCNMAILFALRSQRVPHDRLFGFSPHVLSWRGIAAGQSRRGRLHRLGVAAITRYGQVRPEGPRQAMKP